MWICLDRNKITVDASKNNYEATKHFNGIKTENRKSRKEKNLEYYST